MQLALATWQEVEEYLRSSRGIIIPIGSTEQHGPNGLIGTDHLDAEFVSKGVGDSVGCLVAPTLTVGMSQHHLAFTGTITLRPTTLIAVVNDVVNSLIRHGFERFLFINGHGGNIAPVSTAFSEIYAEVSLRAADRYLAGALQDGDVGGRAAGAQADQGTIWRLRGQPCHRVGGVAVAILPAAARSSTRRCRRRWRRAAPSSTTAPTTAAASRTAASVPTRHCRRPSMASASTPPRWMTWWRCIGSSSRTEAIAATRGDRRVGSKKGFNTEQERTATENHGESLPSPSVGETHPLRCSPRPSVFSPR